MAVIIPPGILNYIDVVDSYINRSDLAGELGCIQIAGFGAPGHCYGSDGGSGIPSNFKVLAGRGGDFEVWELSQNKQTVLRRMIFSRCQYCQKYYYNNPYQDPGPGP